VVKTFEGVSVSGGALNIAFTSVVNNAIISAIEIVGSTTGAGYTLSVNTTGSGTVSKNPDKSSYTSGESVTLTAVPATGYQFSGWGGGASGTTNPLTLTMNSNKTISATFTANTSTSQQLVSFTLINASSDQDLFTLTNGQTLNLSTLPTRSLAIRANTTPTLVGSVKMSLSGPLNKTVTENSSPYSLFGDNSGNYNAWTPAIGSYTLTGTPYTASGGGGTAGTALTVSFTVVDQATSTASVASAHTVASTEQNSRNMLIHPNPGKGGNKVYTKIMNFGKEEAVNIIIHDVTGRLLKSLEVITDEQGVAETEFSIRYRGLYIIRALSASGEVSQKLVIE